MPNGVEVITRNGYIVAYRAVPWDAETKKKGRTRSFKKESDAQTYKRIYETQGAAAAFRFAGVDPDTAAPKPKMTAFAEYAMSIADRNDAEYNTRRGRRAHASAVGKAFPTERVDDITRAMILGHLADLRDKGRAPGTVRNRFLFLNRVFTNAVTDKLISDSPMKGIEPPDGTPIRDHNPPKPVELDAYLAIVRPSFRIAVLLAYESGLREAEIAGLRWKRLNFAASPPQILVRDVMEQDKASTIRDYTKSKLSREVPIGPRTMVELERLRDERSPSPNDCILQNTVGGRMNPKRMSEYWSDTTKAKAAFLPAERATFHDLRHAATRNLVDNDGHVRLVQKFLGHASLATTQIYMRESTVSEMATVMARIR